jgi:hypothetical protein
MSGWEAKMSKIMTLKPRLSEKTYGMSEALNVYTFEVPVGATKHTVAAAVKAQYDVYRLVCVLQISLAKPYELTANLPARPKPASDQMSAKLT